VGARFKLRSARKPVVLVVDDDARVREVLHAILDGEYQVADAADGGEAVKAVRARPVDLVLLDILFPEVDGIEILKELKAIAPGIPVIMLAGVRTIRTTVAAMKLGAVDYVTKPFHVDELLELIRGAIVPRVLRARQIIVMDSDPGRRAALTVLLGRIAADVAAVEDPNDLDRTGGAPSLCVVLGLGPASYDGDGDVGARRRRSSDPGNPRSRAPDDYAALHPSVDPIAQGGAHRDPPGRDPGAAGRLAGGRRRHRGRSGASRFTLSRARDSAAVYSTT
jgi:CheY-like chemotaxis protein